MKKPKCVACNDKVIINGRLCRICRGYRGSPPGFDVNEERWRDVPSGERRCFCGVWATHLCLRDESNQSIGNYACDAHGHPERQGAT